MVEMDDSIECPVCLTTIMDPPVYMCVRSHIFCEDCHISLNKNTKDCPVCKGELAGNRNIPVERMLDSLPKTQCKNQGCSFKKVDPKKVESHEDGCQYRLIKCLTCKMDFPLINLPDHHWNVHKKLKVKFKLEFGSYYSPCLAKPTMSESVGLSVPLEIDGKYFFLNRFDYDNGRHIRWISQSESKKKTEKYKYSISILCPKAYDNGNKIKRLLTYTGFCPSTDLPIEAIKNNVPCLSLPEEFLLENLDKDGKYHFEWRIDVLD